MTELLLEGDRVVVVGGPWPERKGCHGTVLRAGRATTRVGLDDDPLAHTGQADDVVFDTEDLKIWRRVGDEELRKAYVKANASALFGENVAMKLLRERRERK